MIISPVNFAKEALKKGASVVVFQHFPRETLINSADEMKHEAHGTQQPRHINKISAGASTAQQSNSLV